MKLDILKGADFSRFLIAKMKWKYISYKGDESVRTYIYFECVKELISV